MQPSIPSKSTNSEKSGSDSVDAPSFSRPAQVEPGIATFKGPQPVHQGHRYADPAPEAPVFARPTKEDRQPMFHSVDKSHNYAQTGEFLWIPFIG